MSAVALRAQQISVDRRLGGGNSGSSERLLRIPAGEDRPDARRAFADPRAYPSWIAGSSLERTWVRSRRSWIRAGLIVAAGLLTGCTMCPDIYDYSGPVPNGSAPQNDFRARSNGITPIGTVARPWPPLVKREGPTEPAAVLVTAETPADDLSR